PASRASEERARTVARSAPGGATAMGRFRSAGATSSSTVVQKAGGSMKRTDRGMEGRRGWLRCRIHHEGTKDTKDSLPTEAPMTFSQQRHRGHRELLVMNSTPAV